LEFSGLIWIQLHQLVHSLSLSALTAGVLSPALATAAIILAIANTHLPLATICAISSLLIFAIPLVVFMFGSRLQLVLATQ
jgi:hypothetical protein